MIEDLKPYPRMQDSGGSLLGKVPEHWQVIPLCSIAKPKKIVGQQERELLSVYLDRGVIRFSDVQEKRTNVTSEDLSKYQAVDPGDFVLNNQQAWRGSVGVSFHTGIVSPAYLVLSLDSRIDSGFANRLFRDRAMVAQYLISSKGVGSIQRNLYWPHLKRVLTLLPPADEQAAIVRFLDYADRRIRRYIRAKRQLITLLNEQKQAIIHRAVTRGLDPNVRLSPSGVEWLGDVPAHWYVRRNGYLFRERKEAGDPALPLLVVSLRTGVTIGDEVDENGRPKRVIENRENYRTARMGDLAYNMMRLWQGAVGVAPVDGLVSPAYVVATSATHIETKYYELLFRTAEYKAEVNRCSRGIVSDRNRCYWEDFKQLMSPLPPPEEQHSIVEHLGNRLRGIDKAIKGAEDEATLIREFRVRLIADVVTGKLDVRQTAARLSEEVQERDTDADDFLEGDDSADDAELDAAPEEVEA